MAFYPKIDSLCPYKGDLSEILDDDICRLCKREVFDLTAMSDTDRAIFLKSCDGEVCVSYKMPFGRALATAVVTTSGVLASTAAMSQENTYCDMIIVGGIKDPSHVALVEMDIDKSIPMLPVVFEDVVSTNDKAVPALAKAENNQGAGKAVSAQGQKPKDALNNRTAKTEETSITNDKIEGLEPTKS